MAYKCVAIQKQCIFEIEKLPKHPSALSPNYLTSNDVGGYGGFMFDFS